jgi:S-disulfanyl-L-cysteine oxidoreductase SoxD
MLSSVLAVGTSPQTSSPRSTIDGVYTQAQAERGREAYTQHCAGCHHDDLSGSNIAAPLAGTRFIDAWREDTLSSLFDQMVKTMPRDAPSTLPPAVYADIVAFVLSFNGLPAGQQELTAENIPAVVFVGPSGPQPLPNLAVVRVVGCLTAGDKGAWSVTQATDPTRDRAGRTTTPQQLAGSREATLGMHTFQLQNLDYLTGVTPQAYAGHKVQVKGALSRRQGEERISVTSLETVATSCP